MSKTCKECGHQMDDNAQACPHCGCPAENASECPVENTSASDYMDTDVLNECKSTEAESTIKDYADAILKWGRILAICGGILNFLYVLINGIVMMANDEYGGTGMSIFYTILSPISGILTFIITKFIAKLIWATIMLFVNISTTLKRIEIKLDEYGTH